MGMGITIGGGATIIARMGGGATKPINHYFLTRRQPKGWRLRPFGAGA